MTGDKVQARAELLAFSTRTRPSPDGVPLVPVDLQVVTMGEEDPEERQAHGALLTQLHGHRSMAQRRVRSHGLSSPRWSHAPPCHQAKEHHRVAEHPGS